MIGCNASSVELIPYLLPFIFKELQRRVQWMGCHLQILAFVSHLHLFDLVRKQWLLSLTCDSAVFLWKSLYRIMKRWLLNSLVNILTQCCSSFPLLSSFFVFLTFLWISWSVLSWIKEHRENISRDIYKENISLIKNILIYYSVACAETSVQFVSGIILKKVFNIILENKVWLCKECPFFRSLVGWGVTFLSASIF